ncbi:PH domain-containing protein [Thermomonospora echinospora]|uniref:PH domain-containing protein n=1 Tax=Thermomonospora echinospora TaxID=1992 RepID=A0A1H5SF30_9ACTN|nr:PH domain-containing protein [Thermomonospora echinospora]SEF49283.1 PH domain-containing protein [Thermomonospora echinospora]
MRSSDLPSLPVVWRPRRTRIVAYTMAGVIVLGMVVLAIVVAPPFTVFDRVLLVALGLFLGWLLHMFARCRVVADQRGVTVVNAFRTRRLEWPEVLSVTMAPGEPWPTLDLADGTSIGAMGINGAEKPRAAHQLTELRALLAEHAEAPDR